MTKTAQQLLPLSYDRKLPHQVALDHLVKASFTVTNILNLVANNGNVDSIEFDCEISPTWAIRVVGDRVSVEKFDVESDDLINTIIDIKKARVFFYG